MIFMLWYTHNCFVSEFVLPDPLATVYNKPRLCHNPGRLLKDIPSNSHLNRFHRNSQQPHRQLEIIILHFLLQDKSEKFTYNLQLEFSYWGPVCTTKAKNDGKHLPYITPVLNLVGQYNMVDVNQLVLPNSMELVSSPSSRM